MIRLYMGYDNIIRLFLSQYRFQIREPFFLRSYVYAVHNHTFIIQNHIGVIRNTVWHDILALKQSDLLIIHPHILYGIGNRFILCNSIHAFHSPFLSGSPVLFTGHPGFIY